MARDNYTETLSEVKTMFACLSEIDRGRLIRELLWEYCSKCFCKMKPNRTDCPDSNNICIGCQIEDYGVDR